MILFVPVLDPMPETFSHHPLSEAEFDRCLAACGPLEPEPVLAVAVSGGADSMALCLLAHRWVRARGGRVVALTVDHGLRADSTAEAAQVGIWLRKYGIEHHILSWEGPKPATAVQQAARSARYRLLGAWCAGRGILHLLVAHHREDQAETYALRLARGSGVEGLAAMPALGRLPEQLADAPLLLRPLLEVPKARLVSLLAGMGQDWIEDPSNSLEKYQRVRIRRLFAEAAPDGLTIDGAIAAVAVMQRENAALEAELLRFMSLHTCLDPSGFASFDRGAFRRLPRDIALRCLARLIMVIGGRVYPPRSDRLARITSAVCTAAAGGWTSSGCLFEADDDKVLVFREAASCSSETIFDPAGDEIFWDRRFRVGFRPEQRKGETFPDKVTIRKLGYAGWCGILADDPSLRNNKIPFRAKLCLPAVFLDSGLLAVPLLGYIRAHGALSSGKFYCQFDPARRLSA